METDFSFCSCQLSQWILFLLMTAFKVESFEYVTLKYLKYGFFWKITNNNQQIE